jgi:hypothetical protein
MFGEALDAGRQAMLKPVVGSLHPAQRPYRARPRGTVRPHPLGSGDAALREPTDRRRRRLRHRPRPFLGSRPPCRLDRRRRRPLRRRQAGRALGRPPGRSDASRIRERAADVRRPLPRLIAISSRLTAVFIAGTTSVQRRNRPRAYRRRLVRASSTISSPRPLRIALII